MTMKKATATISETFNTETTMNIQSNTETKPSLFLAIHELAIVFAVIRVINIREWNTTISYV